MRALKALVIVMGLLIVAGMTVIVVTIVKRSQNPSGEVEAAAAAGPARFAESRVLLPEAAEVVEVLAEGERLILRLRERGGGERLVLVDMGTGQTLGVIELERTP